MEHCSQAASTVLTACEQQCSPMSTTFRLRARCQQAMSTVFYLYPRVPQVVLGSHLHGLDGLLTAYRTRYQSAQVYTRTTWGTGG